MITAQRFHRLYVTLFNSQPTLVVNSFFTDSQLKLRIQMLKNPKTKRRVLWKYALLLPVAAMLLMCSQKDTVLEEPPIDGEIFTVVEKNPEPQGGIAALGTFLAKNLRYPAEAQKANVQGKVFVRFVVTKTGRIANVTIVKGIGFGCDEESVRVVKLMPDWTPGQQSGKPVNVAFNLPIAFTLQ